MSRAKGQQYEQMALEFLCKKGLTILDRNYHCRQGELDIIAENKQLLIFVEVKYRKNSDFGEPFAFVGAQKQRRMISAALHYCQTKGYGEKRPMRFDVVSIQPQAEQFDIQWLENAFTTDGF